jgi:hypothetical protein
MPVHDTLTDAVSNSATAYALSNFFSVTGATGNPAYLVVSALDRDEYTVGASGAVGSFSGDGQSLALTADGGDARAADIIYTWQASTDSYVNSSFGALSALDYTSSSSLNDVTNISLYGFSSLSQAESLAGSPYALIQDALPDYIGSTTFVTDPNDPAAPPAQATPDSIAATAARLVGDAWNMDGCWVLASTIAAESGAGLPVQSTAVAQPGAANGEWYVAYDGPVSVNANWQSLLRPGDVVVIATGADSGHITTVVSGNGTLAQLIDNITYVGANGQITNGAHDGSSNDILIAAAHPGPQEFSSVAANTVVVYALDTPLVTDKLTHASTNFGGTLALSSLASAADPQGKAITEYQVYIASSSDTLLLNGKVVAAYSAGSAATASSLASLVFEAGGASATSLSGTDTVYVRAYNGTYWGDWQPIGVALTSAAPKLGTPTAAQSWKQGAAVSLTLPPTLFTDPQKSALSYTATGAGGSALPRWLTFNASTLAFTGTVPVGSASFSVVVTATDTLGLSSSETFTVTVPALAPVVAAPTATQTITANQAFSLALGGHVFSDPQGEALTLSATLASGAALPSWLSFNAATGVFSGTGPDATAPVSVKVTAIDTSKLSVSETFTVDVHASAPVLAAQTPVQDLTLGQAVDLALPSATFTDPQGEKLSFTAALTTGGALPSWLHFNGSTGVFTGTAPNSQAALTLKITATDLSNLSASETLTLDFAPAGAGALVMAASVATGGGWPAPVHGLEALLGAGHGGLFHG